VEPGTPDGFARVLAARDVLRAAGLHIAAPCPHQADCPLASAPPDWCHFASRVNRSPLHRRLKDADLGHEDEKFAYVIATDAPVPAAPARVLRHPQKRKGLVTLQLCTPDDGVRQALVSKRQGADYRAARDVAWGDAWPLDPAGRGEADDDTGGSAGRLDL
jgi:ribosomal protein RSM22 (predicted rRNA methylase)